MESLDDKCTCGHPRIEHLTTINPIGCLHKDCTCQEFESEALITKSYQQFFENQRQSVVSREQAYKLLHVADPVALTDAEREEFYNKRQKTKCVCGHPKNMHNKYVDGMFVGCQSFDCNCQKFEWPNENNLSAPFNLLLD